MSTIIHIYICFLILCSYFTIFTMSGLILIVHKLPIVGRPATLK